MSESKFETISSLVDNYRASKDDAVTEKTIDEMLKDDDLSSSWQNYHLIGDIMRDEVPSSLQIDVSKQIAQAITQEATILSPNLSALSEKTPEKSETSQVVATRHTISENVVVAQNRFRAKVSKLIKPLGQLAIAASAAGLMIVGVQQNVVNNQLENTVSPSQVFPTMPLAGYANPVSFNYQTKTQQENIQSQKEAAIKQRIAQQRRFQALLTDHQQQVKLVAGESEVETKEKKY